jgi:glycosyltransferase involved in cell wall biosynthesis
LARASAAADLFGKRGVRVVTAEVCSAEESRDWNVDRSSSSLEIRTVMPIHVWILTNEPSPYQSEFFQALGNSGLVEPHVRFMRLSFRGRRWDSSAVSFEHRGLRGLGPQGWRDEIRIHLGAVFEIVRSKYDFYVLSGIYTSVTFLACALVLTFMRKGWAVWLERPWPDDYRPGWATRRSIKSRPLARLRQVLLRWLLRNATKVFCMGSMAAEAYNELGAADEKLVVLPYLCDVKRFRHADNGDASRLRGLLGLEGKKAFLYSGQLHLRKGVDVLLAAFGQVASQREDVALLLLGDGPMRDELEASVPPNCRDRVHFVGPREQNDLPRYFGAADVFVFPSRYDGWAVVINEACAAGLPVIVTDSVGASRDLVADGLNGFVVPRDDVAALAEKMAELADRPECVAQFGARSRKVAEYFRPERGAQVMHDAIQGVEDPVRLEPADTWLVDSGRPVTQ